VVSVQWVRFELMHVLYHALTLIFVCDLGDFGF
jgi:hypothetical protein